MCLWRVQDEQDDAADSVQRVSRIDHCIQLPEYDLMNPLAVKTCLRADKVRSLAYNSHKQELAALSLNAHVHLWDAQRFTQVGLGVV